MMKAEGIALRHQSFEMRIGWDPNESLYKEYKDILAIAKKKSTHMLRKGAEGMDTAGTTEKQARLKSKHDKSSRQRRAPPPERVTSSGDGRQPRTKKSKGQDMQRRQEMMTKIAADFRSNTGGFDSPLTGMGNITGQNLLDFADNMQQGVDDDIIGELATYSQTHVIPSDADLDDLMQWVNEAKDEEDRQRKGT